VPIGLTPQPSPDHRLEGRDVDRPEDLRERALGERPGPGEAQRCDDIRGEVPAEIDDPLEAAHAGHGRQDEQRQDGRERMSLALGASRVGDLAEEIGQTERRVHAENSRV
jgi:hypothetical protein